MMDAASFIDVLTILFVLVVILAVLLLLGDTLLEHFDKDK